MMKGLLRYRKELRILFIAMIIAGAVMGYVTYGNEPWETVGGVISGLGFGGLVFSFLLK